MDENMIEVIIPINNQEDCDRINKNLGTNYKSTEEHIADFYNALYEKLMECGDNGGWFIGDSIKIKVSMEYEPEDK